MYYTIIGVTFSSENYSLNSKISGLFWGGLLILALIITFFWFIPLYLILLIPAVLVICLLEYYEGSFKIERVLLRSILWPDYFIYASIIVPLLYS